jgi:hypothetical protein
LVVCSLEIGLSHFGGALLLNLGTEIVGIAVTVAVIDLLLERRREDVDAMAVGWRALHDVDYAVWVWQGGRREYSLDELLDLLSAVSDSDRIAEFTEGLFLNIGARADNTRRFRGELLRHHTSLGDAFEQLSVLAGIRDSPEGIDAADLRELLRGVVALLAKHLRLTPPISSTGAGALLRDASIEAQRRRHHGEVVATAS